MSVVTYYRLALALPVLVPGLVYPLYVWTSLHTSEIAAILVMSLVVGGVPYVLLAVAYWWWLRGKPEPAIRRGAMVAPLAMLALIPLIWAIDAVAVHAVARDVTEAASIAYWSAPWVLLLGYSYVALALGLRWVLGLAGVIRRDRAA